MFRKEVNFNLIVLYVGYKGIVVIIRPCGATVHYIIRPCRATVQIPAVPKQRAAGTS